MGKRWGKGRQARLATLRGGGARGEAKNFAEPLPPAAAPRVNSAMRPVCRCASRPPMAAPLVSEWDGRTNYAAAGPARHGEAAIGRVRVVSLHGFYRERAEGSGRRRNPRKV